MHSIALTAQRYMMSDVNIPLLACSVQRPPGAGTAAVAFCHQAACLFLAVTEPVPENQMQHTAGDAEHSEQITIPQPAFAAKPWTESHWNLATYLPPPGQPQAPAQFTLPQQKGDSADVLSDDLKLPETEPACQARSATAPEPSAVRAFVLHLDVLQPP